MDAKTILTLVVLVFGAPVAQPVHQPTDPDVGLSWAVAIPNHTVSYLRRCRIFFRRLVARGTPKSIPSNICTDCHCSCASSRAILVRSSNSHFCSCIGWTRAKVALVCVSLFSSRICWCLRTYALWNRPRWLVVLGVPAVIIECAIIAYATMKISYVPIPAGLQQICVASPDKGFWFIMSWVVPFSFDTAMSTLSIIRAIRVSRELKTLLTTQLVRDGDPHFSVWLLR